MCSLLMNIVGNDKVLGSRGDALDPIREVVFRPLDQSGRVEVVIVGIHIEVSLRERARQPLALLYMRTRRR